MLRFNLILAAIFVMGGVSQVSAVGFEQHINLIDQEYATATSGPADSSLGIIQYEADKYTGKTVYFEAVIKCETCSGGNNRATAGLYTTSGSLVTGSLVSNTSGTYDRFISGNITSNLTNNTDYTVQVTMDADTGTAYLKAARLIIVQSGADITSTQTQVEVGNQATTANDNYQLISSPKVFHYDASKYNPPPTIKFEATMKSSDPGSHAYAALSTASDCSTQVSGSEVQVVGAGWSLARSGSITLSSSTSYFVCIKAEGNFTTSIATAKIILDQSFSLGITAVELHHLMVNTLATDADSTYTAQDVPIRFVPGNFSGGNFSHSFESIMKSSSDTGYARLFNVSDTAEVSYSEVDVTGNVYARKRSAVLQMPASTKIFDTELKNSNAGTTSISASTLIIDMARDPQLTFTIEGVAGSTSTNGITTTGSSQYNQLDFGHLLTSTPSYLAHRLTAATTALYGYSVTAKMKSTLQGNYPANIIEEFPASWATPQAWTEPTGTTANVNTGWIGANTSDTRISGWSNGSGLFGPLGTTSRKVMESTSPDPGTSVYVTYVIEVNQHQPTDLYAGQLVYNILPNY